MTRPVCLPVLFRLYKPKGVTKLVLARQLINLLARRFPDRDIHVVADAAYATRELRGLPARVSVTSRLRKNAVLYDLAPPRTGRRGRPRLKGKRLGAPADLAANASWAKVTVTRYTPRHPDLGRRAPLSVVRRPGLSASPGRAGPRGRTRPGVRLGVGHHRPGQPRR